MFKKIVVGVVCMALVNTSFSQENVHIVKAGESLSVIAKKYGTTVGDIMRLNQLNSKSLLQIGEKLKIPHGKVAPVAAVVKPPITTVAKPPVAVVTKEVPKFIEVTQGQTLFKISKEYNILVDKLKEWNNLKTYDIKIGQKLYLSKPDNTATVVTPSAPIIQVEKKEIDTIVVAPKKETPIAKPIIAEVPKKEIPVKATDNNPKNEEGFFASQYKNTNQELNGIAAILKTNTGWSDKKYYVLINNIPPGSIVKLTANNQSVYAKVLSSLPDMKEDNGILLRLSNAAASVLNVTDEKFNVAVSY